MSQEPRKKNVVGPKLVKNVHGVKFLGSKTSSSTPSRVTRSFAPIASPESSGPAKRTRSMRIKHVVHKKGGYKASNAQDISNDSRPSENAGDDQTIDVQNAEANQVINDVLDEERGSDSGSEEKSQGSGAAKGDDSDAENPDSTSEKTPSVEVPHQKSSEPSSKNGKEPVLISSKEEEPDGEVLIKNFASKKAPGSVQVPKQKKKKEKKEKKVAASIGKKRKHVPDTVCEPDVEQDVPDISTTVKKRVKGKRIPLNVPDAPMDNRRIVVERELSEEALSYTEIIDVIEKTELMKTVTGLDNFFIQLIRELIVNIPSDCDNEDNVEYRKVFVRGKGIDLSPEVINNYLGRSPDAVTKGEPDLDRVANTITGKLVRKWPKKGLLPSGKLTAKYVVLYKIGTANWMATQHLSGVTPPLDRMLYLIGIGGEFDFGNLVYEQTFKHAGSFAVKLPILFPCLLIGLIMHQHPNILRGTASVSGTKASGSSKEDIVGEMQEISKTLQDTIQACKVRKLNVDQLIKALAEVHAAAEEEEVEEETEIAWDENVAAEEEEAQYETVGEEEQEAAKEDDVTGSTSSATVSRFSLSPF
ncbi:uncharacterized protein LOC130736974 [Lotus japonicus]|uniref:uncharacterized protein LOC130736974 n=1 Tax=Lotus japonicus TaxID=34305 RepID=UPI00258950B5|nr:uncharacterized protein LOC130736974 [Lotus japonicus]